MWFFFLFFQIFGKEELARERRRRSGCWWHRLRAWARLRVPRAVATMSGVSQRIADIGLCPCACVALRMPCADQAAPSPCVVRSGPSRAESAALGDGCENAPD